MTELIACQYCGKTSGYYTKLYGTQYYSSCGEDAGYEIDKEGKIARCYIVCRIVLCNSCNHRVNLKKIKEEAEARNRRAKDEG